MIIGPVQEIVLGFLCGLKLHLGPEKGGFTFFSDIFCHAPTFIGRSLAPIGRNDPGPFSTAPATTALTSIF